MPVVILILFSIPLLSLAWWLWADRRLRQSGNRKSRIAVGLAVLLLLGGFAWVILARRDLVTVPIPGGLYSLVLLWGLIFLPLLGIPSMLIWSLGSLGRLLFKPRPPEKIVGALWTRRNWLGAAAVSLPVVGTFGTAGFCLPRMTRFRVREMTVALKDLPEALDGLRIAHVTDTHVGKFTRGKVLDDIVAATNRLQADLVLFTGDLIDNTIRDLPEALHLLERLQAAAGVFVIEGNHDLFDDPAAFERGVRASGVTLLRNEAAVAQVRGVPVQILGIVWNRDEEAMNRDVDTVAALRDPAAFPILLAHHPHAFERAAVVGIPLTLAGHTHGGQIMLTEEYGAGSKMFRYWSGLYQQGASSLVVGNGTGNWFPLRVNAPAEIIHLTLRRG